MTELRVQILDDTLELPAYRYEGDAGLDLRARSAAMVQRAGGRARVATGIAIELPSGHVGLVCPRSGLAAEHGVTVLNAPGVIDAGYRGEIEVVLINLDPQHSFEVARGDRIAQLVVVPALSTGFEIVDQLSATKRGSKGFGQSGRS
jgi:dUTP pyrophosphatase